VACTALLLLTGCSTPKPAKELALQGAAIADKAQAEANDFVDRANQAYKRREAIVRELAEGEIQDTFAGDFRAWIDAQAGVSRNQASIDLVSRVADRSRSLREDKEAAFAAKAKQFTDAAGPAVKATNTNLADAKKAFLVLSQELSPEEWLAFSQSYIRQLQAELKALDTPSKADEPSKP
jgi:hypothetical protein